MHILFHDMDSVFSSGAADLWFDSCSGCCFSARQETFRNRTKTGSLEVRLMWALLWKTNVEIIGSKAKSCCNGV